MFPVLQSLHLLISGPTRLQLSSRRAKRGRWAALCLLLAATTCAPWNTAGAQSGLWTQHRTGVEQGPAWDLRHFENARSNKHSGRPRRRCCLEGP